MRTSIATRIAAAGTIACACACGHSLVPIDDHGRPRRYLHGHHHPRGYRTGRPAHNRLHSDRPLASAERAARHRAKLAASRAALPKVPCHCGCGEAIPAMTSMGTPARYRRGHVARIHVVGVRFGERPPWNKGRPYLRMLGNRYGELLRGKYVGALNPAWCGGTATLPYGPEFTRVLKRTVIERDRVCRRCSRGDVQLEVHHLDHDKANNSPDNLAASCHPCNVWASFHRDESFMREAP